MDMNHRKWIVLAVAVIVAIIVVAGVAWWMYAHREASREIGPGQTLVTPQAGNIVRKFPSELILENSPQILESYRIEYSEDNAIQPFARYVSGKSFAENVDMFAKYFSDNEWEMLRVGTAEETPTTFFVGAKNGNEVNIVLKEEEGRVEVSIAYTLNP